MQRLLADLCLIILTSGLLPGQGGKKQPSFEVADVHVSAPGTKSTDGGFMAGGRVEVRGITMLDLITAAYGVEQNLVIGGPGWLNTDRFDVIAKAPAGVSSEEALPPMLKTLLEDRFKLVAHEGKKDMPVYLLTVAKKGPRLQKAAKEGPPKMSRGTGDPSLNNHLVFSSFTMDALADSLPNIAQNFFDRPVVDQTKLKGSYDFQLDWMGMGQYRTAKANPDGPTAVGAIDAVEKLGLKVDPGTQPMTVVIVDSVNETPTPNPTGVTAKIPTFPTEFEVAELRPAKPGAAEAALASRSGGPVTLGPLGYVNLQNGRVEILGSTLKGLVTLAFDVEDRWIVQAPKWMAEDRFDIIAKTAPTVPFDSIREMLRNLLAQRLQLQTHREDQPMLVYVLTAGKKPKLKESDGAARSDCNIVFTDKRNYVCQNTTMAQFAERLPTVAAAYLHPPLLDLTELKGAYDFQVYWTPKGQLPGAAGRGGGDAAAATEAATPTTDVTVFEAVDKQLGLKLEEQKHPVPVLVIDRISQTLSDK